MHLSIAIPEAQVVEAPACDVEADEQGASYVHGSCAQKSMGRRGIDYSPS